MSPNAVPSNDSTIPHLFSLSVPTSVADELYDCHPHSCNHLLTRSSIELFFEKIHGFVPIFHRPRFYAQLAQRPAEERFTALSIESAFILNGMFALAARFSTSGFFSGIPVKERGDGFALQAQSLYQDCIRASELEIPSLAYLQGAILLNFYQSVSGPNARTWVLTGLCCRLAYDLGLNTLDDDILGKSQTKEVQWSSVEDWVQREELRRAWWSVWELDTFSSTLSCRPFTIDRNRMQVLLPAPDKEWFSETPIASAGIGSTPLSAWKSLQGSPNQDVRAWFLVCNFLMELAHEMSQKTSISPQVKRDMESALSCFALVLPGEFHLSSGSLIFDEENYTKSNWIIATNLMLQRLVTQASAAINPGSPELTPA
jgi:hypothetical protein